jgi:hypothetical protein
MVRIKISSQKNFEPRNMFTTVYSHFYGFCSPGSEEKTPGTKDGEDDRRKRYSKRQSMFFTAITKFAIKNSMGQFEQYYAKARRVPHVIGHYNAGARLIGLTDKQMKRHLAKILKTSKGVKSPYAKPLQFVTLAASKSSENKRTTGRKNKGQFQSVSIGPEHATVRRERRQAVTLETHSDDEVALLVSKS